MKNESVAVLIKDLTAKLAAVAEEFSQRADEIAATPAPMTEVDAPAAGSADLAALATRLVAQRRARQRYLPGELFHEPAWDMLLALFVAHHRAQTLNIKALVSESDAPVTTSQRWIEHLHKLRLIDRVVDPIDRRRVEISLSDAGLQALTRYLADAAAGTLRTR